MKAPEFAVLEPMLLEEVRPSLAPDGQEWTAEIKFDGYRLLAGVADGKATLRSRNGANATSWYPELQSLGVLPGSPILDGEVCVLDSLGRSDFNRLHDRSRRRGRPSGSDGVVFCAFDLLAWKGRDLRQQPLYKRKAALAKLLATPVDSVMLCQDMPGQVRWLYQQALALELEGVVAKRLDSLYLSGERSSAWLKVKRPGAVPPERFKR